jgi:hypothetical protein
VSTWFIRILASICNFNRSHPAPPTITIPNKSLPHDYSVALSRNLDIAEKGEILNKPSKRPLKTIQWVEIEGKSSRTTSRMVISGRFADVCAEIERLAALEGV